jgi:hypothetical protein
MVTPKVDYDLKDRCGCILKVGGPEATGSTRQNRLVSMIPPDRVSLIGMFFDSRTRCLFLKCYSISESPELPYAAVLGASQGWNHSFETLKLSLSSRGGQGSLYVLPIEQATEVIDVLERVSVNRLACIVTS